MEKAIELKRNKHRVDTLFSAFGRSKETTLTAGLAYLIWKFQGIIGRLFVKGGSSIEEVSIEESEKDAGRYDVLISTKNFDVLIEAKRGWSQNANQIKRYLSKRKKTRFVLVDRGSSFRDSWVKESLGSKRTKIDFVSWDRIYRTLRKIDTKANRKKEPVGWAVAKDLMQYMEENGMADKKSKEVYVKDMSGESIDLFFRHHIYKCQPKYFRSATGNSYFAPYFTGKASHFFEKESMIKVRTGITWMAKVKSVELIRKNKILKYLKKNKWPEYKEAGRMVVQQAREKDVLILLLGEPFQVFMTPVEKGKLNIHGPIGSRSLAFEILFQAASKGH